MPEEDTKKGAKAKPKGKGAVEPEAPKQTLGLYPPFASSTRATALQCLTLLLADRNRAHVALQGKWLAGALQGSVEVVQDAGVACASAALLVGLCGVQVRRVGCTTLVCCAHVSRAHTLYRCMVSTNDPTAAAKCALCFTCRLGKPDHEL